MTDDAQSRGPGRRAVLRWSWRLFRREWRQQVTVIVLLTVAVAGAVAGATMTVNAASQNHGFGDAHGMARIEGLAPDAAATQVAAARERFGSVEVIAHTVVPVPGSVERLDVRAQDPAGAFSGPLLRLRAGRYPRSADEVALTAGAAELLGIGAGTDAGGHVTIGGVSRTVVGRVENPSRLDDDFVLVPPDEHSAADSLQLLFDPSEEGVRAGARAGAANLRVMVEGDNGPVAVLVLIAMTLALALVGLIAAAGFVVVANRRQRQLGMLAAIGAPQRHLRLVMLANGALVGVVAALVGTVLGLIAWVAAAPAIERVANHRIDRLNLPWQLVGACMLLAMVMGMAAAWWPARAISKMPVMRALSGRPSRPRPIHRSAATAIVVSVLGMIAIAVALPTGQEARPWLLIGGMVAVVFGAVFAAPAAVRAVAAPATRLPLAARIALRDLARHQARASAALAAIVLGLGIAVAVLGLAKASEYGTAEGNMSDHQVLIWVGDHRAATPNLSAAELAALDDHAATVAATLGHPTVIGLDVALAAAAADDPNLREPISEAQQINAHSFRYVSQPYVATPELLRYLGIDSATVAETTDLLTAHTEATELLDITKRSDDDADGTAAVQRIDVPTYTSAPSSLVTEAALQRHGWLRVRAGWLIQSATPLTSAQLASARSAAAAVGLSIESRDGQNALATIRTGATVAGALVALAIVAMTIGLLRAESTRDLQTLNATGASSQTRRSITATTAATLALLGVVLGTAGAYAALAAGYHGDLAALFPLPASNLALLGIGLPAAAAAAGWLLAGREPPTLSRQPLD